MADVSGWLTVAFRKVKAIVIFSPHNLAREDCLEVGLSQKKVFVSWLMPVLSIQDSSAALSLSHGELLSTKTVFWVNILQLT